MDVPLVCRAAINQWVTDNVREISQAEEVVVLQVARAAEFLFFETYIERHPFHTSILTGRAWMRELIQGRPEVFQQNIRMPRDIFFQQCATLVNDFGLNNNENSNGVQVEESVAMFLHVLKGFNNRDIQGRFQHSGETVSRHFHAVLKAMKKFTIVHCRPTRDQQHPHPKLFSQRKYTHFKDCIGALDGTHVPAKLGNNANAASYFSRKGFHTQNILAVCDFDLCFIFVSCGWERSMHDSRIFKEIIQDPNKKFPHPEPGKYYLVDAGYSNKAGYLAPFKGCRYHLPEFQTGPNPRNWNELYNKVHASLRSAIERSFGVWKARWASLHNMDAIFDYAKVQVPVVASSMALHNFIRRNSREDVGFERVEAIPEFHLEDIGGDDVVDCGQPSREDDVEMSKIRKSIRQALVNDHLGN